MGTGLTETQKTDTPITASKHGDVAREASLSLAEPKGDTLVAKTVTINRPREELYDYWRNLEGLPSFMENIERVEALGAFLETEDGANLLTGYKRAANILKAEEKKDGKAFAGSPDESRFEQEEEKILHAAIAESVAAADAALKAEDFEKAMGALSSLRAPVDAFFDAVTVNAERPELRQNRLLILGSIRDALHRVADFSKVSG